MVPFSFLDQYKLIITCEHASNAVPSELKNFFLPYNKLLTTHEAYDLGALKLAKSLLTIADFHQFGKYSRLVIDLNRSLHHHNVFSFITKNLLPSKKEKIILNYYNPYREAVLSTLVNFIQNGFFVLHLSIHSFTTILKQINRNCDIGLLYDPARLLEVEFCRCLKQHLLKFNNDLKIRFNYPYLGKADGFTSFLRKKFPHNYLGIEIEVNQKFFLTKKLANYNINYDLLSGLQTTLGRRNNNAN